MRGTGDSEGVCLGEYLLQEQEDCLAVIEWLAAQPWCSGRVGMIGISWGGFNGLQVAARRPEALGAVISLCSTDDRYADDIHCMGGAVLTEKLGWGATAFAIAHTPPDPAIVGERWRDMWLERLEGNGLWLLDWFRHQHRDDFYRHGSICENYGDVTVPVYLVGGWADGYTNTILRMLDHLACPRKGLIGPWGHKYPHFARPGPRIGFLQECLRWWDQHLKGIDTGIMDEPRLRAWIQHPAAPAPYYETRAGHWVTAPGWAGGAAATKTLFPGDGRLSEESAGTVNLSTPENSGHAAGNWCGYSVVPDAPVDQAGEAGMVCFDTAPLDSDLELLGFPGPDRRGRKRRAPGQPGRGAFGSGRGGQGHTDQLRGTEPDPSQQSCETGAPARGAGLRPPAAQCLRAARRQGASSATGPVECLLARHLAIPIKGPV